MATWYYDDGARRASAIGVVDVQRGVGVSIRFTDLVIYQLSRSTWPGELALVEADRPRIDDAVGPFRDDDLNGWARSVPAGALARDNLKNGQTLGRRPARTGFTVSPCALTAAGKEAEAGVSLTAAWLHFRSVANQTRFIMACPTRRRTRRRCGES